jgi:hypothetical protein
VVEEVLPQEAQIAGGAFPGTAHQQQQPRCLGVARRFRRVRGCRRLLGGDGGAFLVYGRHLLGDEDVAAVLVAL